MPVVSRSACAHGRRSNSLSGAVSSGSQGPSSEKKMTKSGVPWKTEMQYSGPSKFRAEKQRRLVERTHCSVGHRRQQNAATESPSGSRRHARPQRAPLNATAAGSTAATIRGGARGRAARNARGHPCRRPHHSKGSDVEHAGSISNAAKTRQTTTTVPYTTVTKRVRPPLSQ